MLSFKSPFALCVIFMSISCSQDCTGAPLYRYSGCTFVYKYINSFLDKVCIRVWMHKIKSQINPLNCDNDWHNGDERDEANWNGTTQHFA